MDFCSKKPEPECPMKKVDPMKSMFQLSMRSLYMALAVVFISVAACKRNTSVKTEPRAGDVEVAAEESESAEDKTLLQKTSGVIQNATDTTVQAANEAGTWISDRVQDGIEGGKNATVNAGNAIKDIFKRAKDGGMTTANNVADFVKEDISKMGAWSYTQRTVTNENPQEVVNMLNRMGREKWECFWVDKQPDETTLYFKKSPKSYISSIPFKDMIRYLPELGGNE